MKEKILLLMGIMILGFSSMGVQAAEKSNKDAIQVEITSPKVVEAAPIYEGEMEIAVTNLSDREQKNLNCFLSVVDEDRKQSFPMDEFGPESYQTRTIESLQPGETVTLKIPVRIMYVGNFHLVANVVDYEANQVYVAPSVPVTMVSNTNLHKGLVLGVAICMPVLLAGTTVVLGKKRGAV